MRIHHRNLPAEQALSVEIPVNASPWRSMIGRFLIPARFFWPQKRRKTSKQT
jgi:hypothetical protein